MNYLCLVDGLVEYASTSSSSFAHYQLMYFDKKILLVVALALGINMFPNFLTGLHSIKNDVTFLYCSASKSCNEPH